MTLSTPFGSPARVQGLDDQPVRRRADLGGLEDHGVAAGERHRDGADAEDDRRVPRRHADAARRPARAAPSRSVPGLSEGMISPATWVVIAAASRSISAAKKTLKPIQGPVAPVSAIGGLDEFRRSRTSSASAALSRIARRAFGPGRGPAREGGGGGLDRAVDVGAAGGRGAGRDLAGDRVAPLEARLAARDAASAPSISIVMSMSSSLAPSPFRAVIILWRRDQHDFPSLSTSPRTCDRSA